MLLSLIAGTPHTAIDRGIHVEHGVGDLIDNYFIYLINQNRALANISSIIRKHNPYS